MALPILNNATLHEMTIPSTGKTVSYRPYLVKEEKILLQAKESNDEKMQQRAVLKLIKSCVEDIDVNTLTTFDVEYIFLMLRSKSSGETVELQWKCESCGTNSDLTVNLDDVHMSKDIDSVNNVIELTKDVSIEMKFINYNHMINMSSTKATKDETAEAFKMIKQTILSVNTEEERIVFDDESVKDQDAFIDSLSSEQFAKISGFISDEMPSVVYDKKHSCSNCKEDLNVSIRGMANFF